MLINNMFKILEYQHIYLACKNLADIDPVIKPYKVADVRLIALYGIITRSLPAYYLCSVTVVNAGNGNDISIFMFLNGYRTRCLNSIYFIKSNLNRFCNLVSRNTMLITSFDFYIPQCGASPNLIKTNFNFDFAIIIMRCGIIR